MPVHRDMTGVQIHVPYTWEYADAATREAASGFEASDEGKLARQLDDDSLWMLTDYSTPGWTGVGGGNSTDTHASVSKSGSQVLADVDDINFTASGSAGVTVSDDGDGSVSVDVTASVTGLPWYRETSNFTVSVNTGYKVASGVVATLPSSPSNNDEVRFSPLGDMTAANGTIARNGNTIMGISEDMVWDMNVGFSLIFDGTNSDWRLA